MQSIITRFMGPTNTRGARIRAKASGGQRVISNYSHELLVAEEHDRAVKLLALRLKWGGRLVRGDIDRGYVYVFDPAVEPDSPLQIAG